MTAAPSIWLVGCGNMGGAMLRGWLAHGVHPDSILIIDPVAKNVPDGVRLAAAPEGPAPDILVLAIKPQSLAHVALTFRQECSNTSPLNTPKTVFVFRFIEALAAAGEAEGLSPALARQLALHTVAGSARLSLATDTAPAELAEAVRSPNGTTHAGLTVMDASDLRDLVRATVKATAQRSWELAEAARTTD
ncbi:MAG: hypothetical protein EBS50_08930 [Sphingomonadaceae bacterium]|nr:hypothetical protein [Sphingomonadaceae bacterium]